MEVVDAEYTETNKDLFGKDWAKKGDYRKSPNHRVIMAKSVRSEQELQSYLSNAREAMRGIKTGNNGGPYDYDICFTDKCWGGNSNTLQRVACQAMAIEIKLPKDVSLSGFNGRFYNGLLDDIPTKLGAELQKEQP